MVDMFEIKMCNYCKNTNCNRDSSNLNIIFEKGVTTYKCNNYIKNNKKVKRYEPPLTVTAKRDYVRLQEV